MGFDVNNEDMIKFLNDAQLVFMVNFTDNTQHVTVKENVPVGELLISPFRLAVHLNDLIEKSVINEGQAGKTVEETPKAEAE